MFDPDDNPIRNNVAWFLTGDFLRLRVSCCSLVIRVSCCSFFEREKNCIAHFVFFPDNSEIPATPWT